MHEQKHQQLQILQFCSCPADLKCQTQYTAQVTASPTLLFPANANQFFFQHTHIKKIWTLSIKSLAQPPEENTQKFRNHWEKSIPLVQSPAQKSIVSYEVRLSCSGLHLGRS